MITLDQLVVFKTVIETGSFRSAAETLHRAQSAISYAISNLESELDVRLFDRSSYRPQLTEQGKSIFQKALIVLMQTDDLTRFSKHLSLGNESEIKLAINGICPFDDIINVINKFSNENPAVRIKLSVENLGGSIEQLMLEEVDIALAEVTEWQDELEGILLNRIEFLPVAAPRYPPAKSKNQLTKSEMIQYTQIVVADSSRRFEPKTAGVIKESLHWTVNDFSIKRKLLLSGSGWGMMPRHLVEEDLSGKKLVELDYEPSFDRIVNFYLLRKKSVLPGPMVTKIWNQLKKTRRI